MIDLLFRDAALMWLAGIFSALLSIVAYFPYARDTLAGRTQPQRASWFIWSVLSCIALCSQIYEGALASLWFAAVQTGGTVFICVIATLRGEGSLFDRRNIGILVLAGVGLLLWSLTASAAYALAITITISLMGGVATVRKAYTDPASETLSTWMISWAASACAVVAVGQLNVVLLAYPLYLLTLYSAIVGAMLLGRARTTWVHAYPAE